MIINTIIGVCCFSLIGVLLYVVKRLLDQNTALNLFVMANNNERAVRVAKAVTQKERAEKGLKTPQDENRDKSKLLDQVLLSGVITGKQAEELGIELDGKQ